MKKILLILSVVMTVALIFSALAINTFAAETEIVPDYNDPKVTNAAYQMFVMAEGESSYTWYKDAGNLVTCMNEARNFNGSFWIYLKGTSATEYNYNYNGYSGNWNDGDKLKNLTIDFNNKNVNATERNQILGMYAKTQASSDYVTNITIKNGSIKVKGSVLKIDGGGSSDVYGGKTKVANIKFDNMKFSREDNATGKAMSAIITQSFTGTNNMELNINFNKCTFDYSKQASLIVVDDSSANEYCKINTTFTGACNFGVPSMDKLTYLSNGATGDTITSALPTSTIFTLKYTDKPDTTSTVNTTSGLMHLATKTNGITKDSVQYVLSNTYDEEYKCYIPTGDANKVFSIFSSNGYHIASYNVWGTDSSSDSTLHRVIQVLNSSGVFFNSGNGVVTVRLNKDYDTKNESKVHNNFAQIGGTLVVDLNGHTFTQSNTCMFNSEAKNKDQNTRITIKDGKMIANSPIVRLLGSSLSSENFGYNGLKQYGYTFENVEFLEVNAPIIWAERFVPNIVEGENVRKYKVTSVYNNCTLNVASGVKVFDFAPANGEGVYYDADITVNGGKFVAENFDDVTVLAASNTETQILKVGATAPALEITGEGKNAYVSNSFLNATGAELVYVRNATGYTLSYKDLVIFVPKSSVTLWSDFKYNVYIPAINSLTAATVNGEEVDLTKTVVLDGRDYYKHTVALKVYESLEDVTLVANATVDGKDFKGNFTLSLLDYAIELAKTEQTLAKDMLSYAKAAYTYFPNAPEAADKLAAIDTLLGENYDANNAPNMDKEIKTPGTSEFNAVTFHLGEAPAYRFYYSGTTAPSYTFNVGSRVIDTTLGSDNEGNYVEVKVYAYELLKGISFTDGTNTYEYNVYSYYSQATDASVKHLVERLVKYCESANAYRESVKPAN